MTRGSFVTVTRPLEGVACVTLDRPERMNALSMAVSRDVLATLEGVAEDTSVGAVVLTGAGRGFCAGGDVKEMEANRGKTLAERKDDLALMHRIPRVIAEMPQVAVAAVNGAAYGAGFAMAITCDIVLAGEGARFGTAFLKQGLVSDFGLSYQLTQLAGPAVARQVIFTDRVLSATDAQRLGLVSAVHPAEALLVESFKIAEQIARWPGEARAGMKRLLRQAETADHATMLDREAAVQGRLIVSEAHAEAVDAFNIRPANSRETKSERPET
ncbi:MAG: enoyl-CoA hydratase/isomerase family protein [Nitratireductor sp.]|nr:enoyl-CoA hydratase/isomerase family protein [Nitratireductor sp.]